MRRVPMHIYAENAPTIQRLWGRLRARLGGYPPALRALGEQFFAWAGPEYFSKPDAAPLMHLPIWLDRGVDPSTLDDILEATALAYVYVRIQDNVIDEPETRGHPPLLLLGNALLWDSMAGFRKHGDNNFWARSRHAWLDFSEFTERERMQTQVDTPYAHEDFVAHAKKCALAEVPLYAVMAATGDWRGADKVPALVHALARSYGCVNDVMGHARDLQSGAHTYLWSEVRQAVAYAGKGAAPSHEALRTAMFTGSTLDDLLEEAIQTLHAARELADGLSIAAFPRFTDQRVAHLAALRARISLLRLSTALSA